MSSTTHATQQALVAAAARPCTGLGRGYRWNASVGMTMGSLVEFQNDITTIKHTARHLGSQPT